MYPQGYFHQMVSPEGWQQEIYERLNWTDAPIEPAITARRQALHRRRAARQPQRARVGVAGAARTREAVPARHRPRGERAVGPRAVGAALRRRPRDAHPAGDHPRHRRRPRAEGARSRSRRSGTSTKATPPSSCCSASAIRSNRASRSKRRSQEVRRTTMFTTHTPVPAGPRRVPVQPGRDPSRRRVGHARQLSRCSSWRSGTTTTAAVRCST